MRRRSASASCGMRRPSTSILPSLGVSSPHSMRMVVDLPEPLGPRKPYTCARGTVRSTPSTARSWTKHLLRPRARMAIPSSGASACIAEFHPQRQPCRQLAGALAFQLDLRSEEHTSELQSRENLVCRLLLEKKKKKTNQK